MESLRLATDWRPRPADMDMQPRPLSALTTAAASHGVARVRADTAPDNVASRRTLERAGFVRVVADAHLLRYEFSVG
jgi:hypothetical protein